MSVEYINSNSILSFDYLKSEKSNLVYTESTEDKTFLGFTISKGIKAGWKGNDYDKGKYWWCSGSRKRKNSEFRYTEKDLNDSENYILVNDEWHYKAEIVFTTKYEKYSKFFLSNTEAESFIRSIQSNNKFIKICKRH